jgi:hypothetical protein
VRVEVREFALQGNGADDTLLATRAKVAGGSIWLMF